MQASTDEKKQDNYGKMKKHESEFTKIKKIIKHIMVHNQHSLPENVYSTKSQNPDTMVPDNKKAWPLEGGYYTKIY